MQTANSNVFKKSLVAMTVVTLVAVVGVVGAHAASSTTSSDKNYSKDQCKNGGWKNFKNPDGSMMFKNQGQCIAFFVHQGMNNGNGNNVDNSVNVDNDVNVDARTGVFSPIQASGSATISTGDSAPSVSVSNTVNAHP